MTEKPDVVGLLRKLAEMGRPQGLKPVIRQTAQGWVVYRPAGVFATHREAVASIEERQKVLSSLKAAPPHEDRAARKFPGWLQL